MGKRLSTDFGISQYFYQGSPVSSYVDVGYSVIPGNYFAVYPEGRKWADTAGVVDLAGASRNRGAVFSFH